MPNGQEKSVTINIGDDDFDMLKDGGYSLCFAKKVNGAYNVVWQSADEYLQSNTFSWVPMYRLFGSNKFVGNQRVAVSTNTQPIELGQQATLNKKGHLEEASTGDTPTALTLNTEYEPIHSGVQAYSTDIHGKTSTTTIYVSPGPVVDGTDILTPVESVQVWFDSKLTTSTMISDALSKAVEIDLTQVNSATRLYQGGKWIVPKSGDLAGDESNVVVITAVVVGAIVVHTLLSKLVAKLTGVYSDITVDVQVAGSTATIGYKERPRLTGARLSQTRQLLRNSTTADQLAEFTLEAFAQLGLGYKSFSAKAAG